MLYYFIFFQMLSSADDSQKDRSEQAFGCALPSTSVVKLFEGTIVARSCDSEDWLQYTLCNRIVKHELPLLVVWLCAPMLMLSLLSWQLGHISQFVLVHHTHDNDDIQIPSLEA